MALTHGSLFSGIGGFDLAASWAGWTNAFHCEINPFGRKVLKYYWSNAISYENIKTTDFSIWRGKIDVLSGGFPCQPYSVAGKRLGTEDDRHLWPEMLRAIREIQPRWVVGENVRGIISWNEGLVFDEVQADLEAEGYQVLPFLLPASGVNAPHQRDRIWFIAYRPDAGAKGLHSKKIGIYGFKAAANTQGKQSKRVQSKQRKPSHSKQIKSGGSSCRMGCERIATNASTARFQSYKRSCQNERADRKRNESTPRATAEFHQGSNWSNFPTQSPVCGRNDGVSFGLAGITFSKWRNESIKAYGNAIVPQVAFQIFSSINAYESL